MDAMKEAEQNFEPIGNADGRSDEQIVLAAQSGDADAMLYLLNKYKRSVRLKARSYFLIGADHEDLVQEGMIGLYKAVRDYRADRQASFYVFSELCIRRQMITAIKAATSKKNIPLNTYVSLNSPIFEDDGERTLLDVIVANASNPEDVFIRREEIRSIRAHIQKTLSPLEKEVLPLFLDGKSYQEIAAALGRQVKAVDNALQRIKKKITRYLEEQSK